MSESKRVLRFVYVPDDGAVPRLETRQASVPAADHGAILERRPVLVSPGKHLQTNHCRGRSLQPLLQASRKKGGGDTKRMMSCIQLALPCCTRTISITHWLRVVRRR